MGISVVLHGRDIEEMMETLTNNRSALPLHGRGVLSPIVRKATIIQIVFAWIVGPLAAANIPHLGNQCRSHQQKACSELVKIAIDDAKPKVRNEAIYQIDDPSLLATIAMESTQSSSGFKALKKLTDQTLIGRIAKEGKDPTIRVAAVWRLTDPARLVQISRDDPNEKIRESAKAASNWSTVKLEHEIVVWKPATAESVGATKSKWKISAAIGAGGTGIGPIDPNALTSPNQSANRDAPGFSPWWFKPETAADACILESGTVGSLNSPKVIFAGKTDDGHMAWVVLRGRVGVLFYPVLRIRRDGTLVMVGSLESFSSYGQGLSISIVQVPETPVVVVGTIRFPSNQWMEAGAGFEILGGGLQFDETGVYLSPGTQYRTIAASAASPPE